MSHSLTSSLIFLLAAVCLIFLLGSSLAYKDPKCDSSDLCLGASNNKCGRYELMELTVELKEHVTNETVYYPFCVKVDKFSRVTLRGSYSWLTQGGRAVSNGRVSVLVGDKRSSERIYADNKNFATTLTSIMNFGAYGGASGVLQSITWDDTCSNNRCIFDYSDRCVNGQSCGMALNDEALTEAIQRDVSIYLGYRGSGKFGNIFTSVNELPSTYRALSFSFSAVTFYDKAREVIPNPFG